MERSDSLIQLAGDKVPTLNLVQIFIEEYFLNLELVSNALEANVALDELQLIQLFQRTKSLFSFISNHSMALIDHVSSSAAAIEFLSFVLSEFYLSLTKVFSIKNQTKFYAFLYTVDLDFFEVCYSLIDQQQTMDSDQVRPELTNINLNEGLKTILIESDISIIDLNTNTTQLERLKLIAMAFISFMSVQCLKLEQMKPKKKIVNEQTDTEVYTKFQKFGETLKNNLYHSIFSSYFGAVAEKSTNIKLEIQLQTSARFYHSLNLMLFLDTFNYSECSCLSFNEYRFSLTVFDTVIRNRSFQMVSDPFVSPILLQILCGYGGFLLMLGSFFTWYKR